VTVCLSIFISTNHLTILSSIAIAGGLYFFFLGFHLLARKRLLLATPTSKIRSAAMGLVEINGFAAGPYTVSAPITGKPCFLYHTAAWQQSNRKKQEWKKVADETLHVPFFINDSTGQLLIEPLGADLDLQRDFREEYDASFFSLNLDDVPPRVSVFLSRHGIVPGRRLRIEECAIKTEDKLFVTGTLTENPGIPVCPFAPRSDSARHDSKHNPAPNNSSEPAPAPQIIRLQSGADLSSIPEMSQQATIAAALTRAGISRPEAWSAAGVPYQTVTAEEKTLPATPSMDSNVRWREEGMQEARQQEDQPASSAFNLTPPVVLMKGAKDPTFVISFRSQKDLVDALAWKSAALVWGGAAIMLLGIYMLLAQMELR
jgi:hypothetical protein